MLISVIIPTYNSQKYISSAVNSVLSQTYKAFELIIVDDGSTDNTGEIVASFDDRRIRYIRQNNSGVAVARNTGIKSSKGEYIAFLDADDIWERDKLAVQIDEISSDDNICMVYSAFNMIYEDSEYITFKTFDYIKIMQKGIL